MALSERRFSALFDAVFEQATKDANQMKRRAKRPDEIHALNPGRWYERYFEPGFTMLDLKDQPPSSAEGEEEEQSDNFTCHVNSLQEARPDLDALKGIRSSLKPWQITGVAKLQQLARSEFRGGFLCDSMGLGKSLTALIAAVNIRKESLPNCGFILVVCKPGCLVQWYDEVQKHFDKDSQPACLILDSTNIPVPRLLQYDVVICSGFFLKERFNDWFLFKNFCLAVHDVGLDRAREVFGHQLKRPFSPLHSSLYDQLSRNIAVLIVDESHECKNEESVLNAAVRSLKYQYAFLLTGTPIYNTWEDLLGQTMLLPCGLFADKEHFQGLFGKKGTPQGARQALFRRLYQGLIAGRLKSLLNLPQSRI